MKRYDATTVVRLIFCLLLKLLVLKCDGITEIALSYSGSQIRIRRSLPKTVTRQPRD